MNKEELVDKFLGTIPGLSKDERLGYWKDYIKYEKPNIENRILIADPSNIYAIADMNVIEKEDKLKQNWKEYTLKTIPIIKKDDSGNQLYFDGYFFGLIHIINMLTKFFSLVSTYKIKLIQTNMNVLAIKIDNNYVLVFSEIKYSSYCVVDEGVYFINEYFDETKNDWVETGREFIQWVNNIAERTIVSFNNEYKEKLYRKDYLFEAVKSVGGLMMI